jgi:hypothetical protein
MTILHNLVRKTIHRHKQVKHPKLYAPPYLNIHQGATLLIVVTGPSVEQQRDRINEFIDYNSPIVIGCNNACCLYPLHYSVFANRKRFAENAGFVDPENTQAIISCYIPKWLVRKRFKHHYWPLMMKLEGRDVVIPKDGIISCSYASVGIIAIGVAIVMGAGMIYIAGMDGYSDLFSRNEKINMLNTITKYDDKERDRDHYLRLQQNNERHLAQMDQLLYSRSGNHLRIITPTVHKTYYQDVFKTADN